jgi:hypothetical protein
MLLMLVELDQLVMYVQSWQMMHFLHTILHHAFWVCLLSSGDCHPVEIVASTSCPLHVLYMWLMQAHVRQSFTAREASYR